MNVQVYSLLYYNCWVLLCCPALQGSTRFWSMIQGSALDIWQQVSECSCQEAPKGPSDGVSTQLVNFPLRASGWLPPETGQQTRQAWMMPREAPCPDGAPCPVDGVGYLQLKPFWIEGHPDSPKKPVSCHGDLCPNITRHYWAVATVGRRGSPATRVADRH